MHYACIVARRWSNSCQRCVAKPQADERALRMRYVGDKAQAMTMSAVVSDFSVQAIKSFAAALPEPVCERRRELLPRILREWIRTDLRRYLPLEDPIIKGKRFKKIQAVKKRAGELSRTLKALDQRDLNYIVNEMLTAEGDQSRPRWADLSKRLDEERDFLTKLADIRQRQKQRPGQPRNYAAYFVLQDAAAIFEWFTGTEAGRVVDVSSGEETGRFFKFASALWPVVFGKGVQGLSAAMKNWAQGRKRHDEASALIENIALRHPTWGVFECE
jgi:hypothetical protein